MSRTNIDIDDEAVEWIMKQYRLRTKRDAVNFALHRLYHKPMTVDEMLAMEGTGWDGEFSDVRPGYEPIDE